jgi:hypothetical protein
LTINIQDIHILRGQEAIEALEIYMEELKTQNPEQENKQIVTRIKAAQLLRQTLRSSTET